MKYGLPLLVLLSVAACGRDPASSPASVNTSALDAKRSAAAEETVAAVQQSSGRAAVVLRFALENKPALGSPTRIRLDFTAAEPLAQVAVSTEGMGMAVDAAGATATLAMAEAGKTVSHTVVVTPQATGFSELIVHLLPSGDGSNEIVYAIPVMIEAAAPGGK